MRMRAEQCFYLGHADRKRVNEFHNLPNQGGWDPGASICLSTGILYVGMCVHNHS